MLPNTGDVHVDAALSQLSISYQNPSFVADLIFPTVPVTKQSDKYFTFDKADMFRSEADVRAVGTIANRGGYRLSSSAYFCDNYAFGKAQPDEVEANADEALAIDQADTEYVTHQVALKWERVMAEKVFATSVWGKDYTGVSSGESGDQFRQWSDLSNSDPITDVAEGHNYILSQTGVEPNTLVLGKDVVTQLLHHPDITGRMGTTTLTLVTEQVLAQLFNVPKVIIGKSIYNSAAETATATMAYNWGKAIWLGHVATSPAKRTPSAGYCFQWGQNEVRRYREEAEKQDVLEMQMYKTAEITGSDLGVYFASAVA